VSTPRVGCKYVFVPVLADRGYFAEGAVVTVVPCPGMARAKVPSPFRYARHDGITMMVSSASLVPLAKYRDFSTRNL
jgi:hypothetical protein